MSFSIQGGREDRTLEYDVTDAASGAPMRITVAGGVLALPPVLTFSESRRAAR